MKNRSWAIGIAAVGIVLAACGSGGGAGARASVTVGSANFPENALLAEIYAGALRAKNLDVSVKLNVGSRETLLPALQRGDVTVVPEYTGALLSYLTKGTVSAIDLSGQLRELSTALPPDLTLLDPSAAQDQQTVTCTKDVVRRHSLVSLEDLAKVSGDVTMGGPPEAANRPGRGLDALRSIYGIEFKRFVPLDVAGPLTVTALKEGKVDCAILFSTQSAVQANGFISLTDPRGFVDAQAVVPLIGKSAAKPAAVAALNAVSARLTTDNLKDMVKRIEVDKEDARTVAKQFLKAGSPG